MTSRATRWPVKAAAALLLGLTFGAFTAFALAEPPREGHAPDPPPLASTKQWLLEITFRQGKMTINRVRSVTVDRPIASPRMMGRYAFELYIGKELLDRVRFNVPLTGDGPPEKGVKSRNPFPRPTFENVSTKLRLQMADNPRATHARLVDRATGEEVPFVWPPEPDGRLLPKTAAPPPPQAGDAGTADAAPRPESDSGTDGGADAGTAADAGTTADAGSIDGGKPRAPTTDAKRSK